MSSIRRAVLVLATVVALAAVATPSSTVAAEAPAQRAGRHWQTVLKFKGVKAQACIASHSSGPQEMERVDARQARRSGVYTSKVIEGDWTAGGGRIPFYPWRRQRPGRSGPHPGPGDDDPQGQDQARQRSAQEGVGPAVVGPRLLRLDGPGVTPTFGVTGGSRPQFEPHP
jgi:hypothetical protein